MINLQIERIFTCLRQIDQAAKKSPDNIQFSFSDLIFTFPLRAITYFIILPFKLLQDVTFVVAGFIITISKYSFSSFTHDVGRRMKTNYRISKFAIALFLSSFFICLTISINMAAASYYGLLFWLYVIFYLIISFFVSLFISISTTKFLKIQGDNIEEFSILDEISEKLSLSVRLREKALAVNVYQKCAAVILKEKIDSLNDLANLANILSSMGVALVALSFFINWSENDIVKQNRTIEHETIAKISAGIFFFCFFIIRACIYGRLQRLRRWLTIIELGNLTADSKGSLAIKRKRSDRFSKSRYNRKSRKQSL